MRHKWYYRTAIIKISDEDLELIAIVLAGCAVLRCEHLIVEQNFEYIIAHPDLRELACGEKIPIVTCDLQKVKRNDDTYITERIGFREI